MNDKDKQIEEMPICVNCVHAYVCEEYNLNRDMLRKKCAYHNDHFLDIEQYKKQERKETAREIYNFAKDFFEWDEEGFVRELASYISHYGVEIEE